MLLTVAVLASGYNVANPSEVLGLTAYSVVIIRGVSLMATGTDAVLPEVYCVSSAASVATILMVSTVDEPGAASSLADISTVLLV